MVLKTKGVGLFAEIGAPPSDDDERADDERDEREGGLAGITVSRACPVYSCCTRVPRASGGDAAVTRSAVLSERD